MTGLDAVAASLTTLEGAHAFHGQLLQKGLAEMPRSYSSLIWNLVHVIVKAGELSATRSPSLPTFGLWANTEEFGPSGEPEGEQRACE